MVPKELTSHHSCASGMFHFRRYSHRCPQCAFAQSRSPQQYNYWDSKFHCIPTLSIEARQTCIFQTWSQRENARKHHDRLAQFDWAQGPSGGFPGYLHEDLADRGISSRKLLRPDAATTARPLMRHYCTILTHTVVWIYAVLCGTNKARCVLYPSHHHRGRRGLDICLNC